MTFARGLQECNYKTRWERDLGGLQRRSSHNLLGCHLWIHLDEWIQPIRPIFNDDVWLTDLVVHFLDFSWINSLRLWKMRLFAFLSRVRWQHLLRKQLAGLWNQVRKQIKCFSVQEQPLSERKKGNWLNLVIFHRVSTISGFVCASSLSFCRRRLTSVLQSLFPKPLV